MLCIPLFAAATVNEPSSVHVAEPAIARLIQMAGTTHDEMERLRLLRQLEARTDLDATLHADLAKLLPIVDDWANGKSRIVVDTGRATENGYLCRFITSQVRPTADGPVHPPEMSEGSPLRPIWCLYQGRMLIRQVIQSSPLLSVKERREKYYGEGRRRLEETRRAFPENRVVRMYLGEPIAWSKSYPADPALPAPSPEILYSSAAGDPGNPLVFPLNAARWRTPPREIAVLVTESSRSSFAAELFHFGAQPCDLEAELFLLSPDEYELILTAAGSTDSPPLQRRAFRVEGPRARVALQLPARRLCVAKVVAK